jgi:hypothetical protein
MSAKLWQLKQISTGEPLNEPQLLPVNWGPIFGMDGFKDKLDDLSWLGIEDKGWFIVGDAPPPPPPAPEPEPAPAPPVPEPEPFDPVAHRLKLLRDSDWSVLPDVPMASGVRDQWIEYRRKLRELPYEEGWPDNADWPPAPNASE